MFIVDKEFIVTGNILKTLKLKEEWYEDVNDPEDVIKNIKNLQNRPDIFTFWQRIPNTEPIYDYYTELESVAVLPITTYEDWWTKQISAKTRNMARKAEKKGVQIRCTKFDDDYVRGLVKIFNETPVRQGKRFWHYGKSFETVKREFSRFIFREDMIGAYYKDELIGFIMLAYAGNFAITGQILSMIKHRDKAPTNALIAKAVQLCSEKNIPYLNYAMWAEGSLGDFKKNNGFQKFDMPRYYIPLTFPGRLAIKFKFHKGVKSIMPNKIKDAIVRKRKEFFANF